MPRTIAIDAADLLALLVNPLDPATVAAFIAETWLDAGIKESGFAAVIDSFNDPCFSPEVNQQIRAKIRDAMKVI